MYKNRINKILSNTTWLYLSAIIFIIMVIYFRRDLFGIFSCLFCVLFVFVTFSKEKELANSLKEMGKISDYRENELRQLDKTTKLIVKRDLELTAINKKLDKEIKDAERIQISMLKAFSDLKKERERTDLEREKTMAIIANFVDPIIVLDKEDKISLMNPAAKSLFVLGDDDLGVKINLENNYSMNNFKKLIKHEYKVRTNKDLNIEDPMMEELDIEFTGHELTYKVITAEINDEHNRSFGIMKIFYNMTREKMIDKMKSEFISIASHQLRTPLTAIKWSIKMVLDEEDGKLNEEQKQMLFKGYRSNERIITLVNDLLNVSRIEEGRFGYSFSEADFEESLTIVLDNLDNRIKEKKLKLNIEKPKIIPKVYMDKQKMQVVLQNLLENAVKYTPDNGSINIEINIINDNFLKISIQDNGIGIPEEDKAKLFSKFYRATNAISLQTEGSGLGLFIVKNIIKKHGGDIVCNSKEGIGTEFIFNLPVKEINN